MRVQPAGATAVDDRAGPVGARRRERVREPVEQPAAPERQGGRRDRRGGGGTSARDAGGTRSGASAPGHVARAPRSAMPAPMRSCVRRRVASAACAWAPRPTTARPSDRAAERQRRLREAHGPCDPVATVRRDHHDREGRRRALPRQLVADARHAERARELGRVPAGQQVGDAHAVPRHGRCGEVDGADAVDRAARRR